jgi:hypothetical protein
VSESTSKNDILPNGAFLQNGMIVLIDDPSVNDRYRHMMWVTVSDLQVNNKDRKLSFVAICENGAKLVRRYTFSEKWVVQLDSIPGGKTVEQLAQVVDYQRQSYYF